MTFHIGLNLDAPFDVIHLAGIEVPKWTEKVEGQGVETKRHRVQGAYLDLDATQAEKVRAAAKRKVFRFAGKPNKKGFRRAILVDKAGTGFGRTGSPTAGKPSKPYKAQADDVDVSRFVYLREVDHNLAKAEQFETLEDAKPTKKS